MWRETDYLTPQILNTINSKILELDDKYKNISPTRYIGKTYNNGELVYLQDIKNMEDFVEYMGSNLGYPEDWIETRKWDTNAISYIDLNRIYHDAELLINNEFNPLLPRDDLYPSETLLPR